MADHVFATAYAKRIVSISKSFRSNQAAPGQTASIIIIERNQPTCIPRIRYYFSLQSSMWSAVLFKYIERLYRRLYRKRSRYSRYLISRLEKKRKKKKRKEGKGKLILRFAVFCPHCCIFSPLRFIAVQLQRTTSYT